MTPLRVFLVENDPDTRIYFAMYLEHMGHSVVASDRIADALGRMRHTQYDVLIADIGLPDGSGWDLMSRMAESGLPAPRYAIAMTGYSRGDDRERSVAAGFRQHLVKPITGSQLEAALAAAAHEVAKR